MTEDYISDFVEKQKERMEAAKREEDERARVAQFWEARGFLIEQKAPQLWRDLREHIKSKVAEINSAGQQSLLIFLSPRGDEVTVQCAGRSVKAVYNGANHVIEFSRIRGTRNKWHRLVAIPVGDEVRFSESMTGTVSLSFEEIMRGVLESFED